MNDRQKTYLALALVLTTVYVAGYKQGQTNMARYAAQHYSSALTEEAIAYIAARDQLRGD